MRPLLVALLLLLLPRVWVHAQTEPLTLAVLPVGANDDLTNPACCAMELGAAALLYVAVGYSDGKSLADTDMKVAAGIVAGAALCAVGACIADQNRLGPTPAVAISRWRVHDGEAKALEPGALSAETLHLAAAPASRETQRLTEVGRTLGSDLLLLAQAHEERSGVGLDGPGEPRVAMALLDVRMGAWVPLDDALLPSARLVRPLAEVAAAGGPAAWAAHALNRPGAPAVR